MGDCADLLEDVTRWLPRAVAGMPVGSCPARDCPGQLHPATEPGPDGQLTLTTHRAGERDPDLAAYEAACDRCGHVEVTVAGRTAAYATERRLREQGITTHRQTGRLL